MTDIDPLATCLAASIRRTPGASPISDDGIQLQDLRRRLRVEPVRKTILFLVDASDSMLVARQMQLAKGAVLGLLTKAYQKRYRVGMITFRDWESEVTLPPTTSITRAKKALQAVATGGGTPLAHGLQAALKMIRSERLRHPNDLPQLILITDGRPSVPIDPDADIRKEVLALARQFPVYNIPAVVLATAKPEKLLNEIADQLKAPLRKLSDVVQKKPDR